MALVLADRVLETTTTTGSGTITLAGAEPGYQSFSAVGNGNQTYYTITADTVWEVGIGTYTASGTTLSRDTVLSSSASGAKVTLPSGVKKVFVTYPSEKSVNFGVSGNISASSGVITDVGYPSAASDAATKLYVDTLAAEGISYHTPVKYEVPDTTGNLNATYNNGTAGVSATLTNAGTLGPFVPDGVTASISDRILIYNQTNAVQNGVYVVTTVGTGASSWVLTRAADANTYGVKSPTALGTGDAFYVTSGNTGAGETYVCNTPGTIVFGSTNITFVQVSAAQVYQAGTGISLTNTTISLVSPVAVANGGTGRTTTPTNGQLLIGNGSGYTLSTLTAGSGVSITNSAGSITLTATGTGGTVVAVTASAPLASTGGVSPNISIANTTGTGSVVLENSPSIFSATITGAVSASITTITGSSANITTVTGTTAGFSSANITHAGITSATVTTLSGTNVTYSSGTVSQLAATSATITTLSGTNVTYPNANFTSASITNLALTSLTLANLSITSANVTTLTGTNLTYTSGTVTNLNSTSANITTLTGTTFGTTATTQIRGASADITTITGTTIGALASSTISGISGNITNLNSTSANITTLTGTTFGTTATTQLRGASADITTLTGTTFGTTATTNLRGLSAQITTLTATSSNITTLTGTNLTYTSGTITNLAATSITVTNTPAFVGNGTLTMNVSGTGLSGSQTFTANQSSNATFTVTSNATSANTASAIVARDASGNFSMGYLTSTGATFTGDITTYRTGGTSGVIYFGTSGTRYLYYDGSSYAMPGANLFVNGVQAVTNSGTWGISISGNAATATTASNVNNGTLTLNVSGTGLSGSQTFTANQSGNATFTVTSNATSTAGAASTIVARDVNGYIFNTYFNSTDNSVSSGVTAVMVKQGDNYLRSGTAASIATFISGQTMNISGSSTSCSGNAATATTATYALNTTQSFNSNWNTDFAAAPAGSTILRGDTSTGSSTGGPGGTWWFQQNMRHTNSSNVWGVQVAWGWEDNANLLRTRNVTGGSYGSWVTYLNSSNYNSYAPTLTGTGASGTWGISISGTATTATTANALNTSNNYTGQAIYAYNWFRSYNATGWYNETYAGGIWMQDVTWIRTYGGKAFYVDNTIACAGNITAYYSDERLKTKTGSISNALDKVSSLEGFTYVENDLARSLGYKNTKQQVGVSAQAVKAVLPEAVALAPVDYETLEDGTIVSKSGEDYLTVDYSRLVPLLIEAIKELKAEVEALKAAK